MRINTNVSALNAHRQLGINQSQGARSMERLSSGLRINRAGDDAAGLSISEKMRGQIRGLRQASANAQGAISMIQTAEGNLNETHSILQRMRELASQAASDTNVGVDRAEIQKEINALTSEINRIGNTTEFNTQKLMRGDGTAARAVGALQLAETGVVAQTSLSGGTVNAATSAQLQLSLTVSMGADELAGQEFTFEFNGNSVRLDVQTVASGTDPMANNIETRDGGREVTLTLVAGDTNQNVIMDRIQQALETALAENANINAADYTFSRDQSVVSITSRAAGEGQSISVIGEPLQDALTGSTDGGGVFNPIADTAQTASGTAETRTRASATLTSFTDTNLEQAILASGISVANADYFSGASVTTDGAVRFLTGKGFTVGNETVEFFNSNEGNYNGKADFAVDLALISFTAGDFTDTEADRLVSGIVEQIGSRMNSVTLSTLADATGPDELVVTAKEPGLAANSMEVIDGVSRPASDVVGSKFTASFQIGANQGQSFTISITDMRSEALNIAGKAGEAHTTVGGAAFTSINTVSDGTDNNAYVAALDVSTHQSASAAITVISDAIEKVSAQRSELGAFQNRLEHTISNLGTSAENKQAAESRIRDVDMAAEMMNFTKANILNQAATAMLAQANMQPQAVLQLLG